MSAEKMCHFVMHHQGHSEVVLTRCVLSLDDVYLTCIQKMVLLIVWEGYIYIRITEFSIDDFDDMMWHFKDNSE